MNKRWFLSNKQVHQTMNKQHTRQDKHIQIKNSEMSSDVWHKRSLHLEPILDKVHFDTDVVVLIHTFSDRLHHNDWEKEQQVKDRNTRIHFHTHLRVTFSLAWDEFGQRDNLEIEDTEHVAVGDCGYIA